MGLKGPLQAMHGIAQRKAALLEAAQCEFVRCPVWSTQADQGIEIGMFDAQCNELPVRRMEAEVQGVGAAGWQKCHRRADNTRLARIPRRPFAYAPPQSPA
ncbi:hypothetical protein GmRootA79_03770 [Acidovorax sp. A79]